VENYFPARDTVLPDTTSGFEFLSKTDLSGDLKGISAISFIDDEHIACLTNENGSIRIYNLRAGTLDKELPFAPPGNYEGLVIVNETAYIGCADGRIFEMDGYNTPEPQIREYGTPLTIKQQLSGLCFDKKNNRLLVTIREKDLGSQFYKGIYAFDLSTKQMPVNPVIRINLQDSIFGKSVRNLQSVFQPADIACRESTGEFYLPDGNRQQLVVLDEKGETKKILTLDKAQFSQPEGMSFSASGEAWICNAGKEDQPASLIKIRIVD